MKKKAIILYLIAALLMPSAALAVENCDSGEIQLQVPLGTIASVSSFGCYFQSVYRFSVGIVGLLAIVMVMLGGVKWITAGGNPSKVQSGKDYIFAAIFGTLLLLSSYMILNFINPQLTNIGIEISRIKAPKLQTPEELSALEKAAQELEAARRAEEERLRQEAEAARRRAEAVVERETFGTANYCCITSNFGGDEGCGVFSITATPGLQGLSARNAAISAACSGSASPGNSCNCAPNFFGNNKCTCRQ